MKTTLLITKTAALLAVTVLLMGCATGGEHHGQYRLITSEFIANTFRDVDNVNISGSAYLCPPRNWVSGFVRSYETDVFRVGARRNSEFSSDVSACGFFWLAQLHHAKGPMSGAAGAVAVGEVWLRREGHMQAVNAIIDNDLSINFIDPCMGTPFKMDDADWSSISYVRF